MSRRPALVLAGVGAAGGALTLVVWLSPWLRFAYRSPSLHVAIETAAALIAILAALLVAGRATHETRLGDLLLVTGLGLFAVANLAFAAVPRLLEAADGPGASAWAPVAVRLEGAVLFFLAAVLPLRPVRRARRAAVTAALAASLSVIVAAATVLAFGDRLPLPLDLDAPPSAATGALVAGHPLLLASEVVSALLLAGASFGFARRADDATSPLLSWLAPAAALLAVARVNYLLFPSLYSDWIYSGDLFRLGGYLSILAGAALEIRSYWARLAAAAVLEERRRLARDLHDGVAQELAFIAREAHGVLPRQELASSAERALDEARRALAALTRPVDEPLEQAIGEAVEEVAARAGGRVRLELEPGPRLPGETREALVRIAREAVANAIRHGGTGSVVVQLGRRGRLRLRVADDGAGFDPGRAGAGHGLTSMRERAEQVGATLSVASSPGAGTEVVVVLP